MGMEMSGRVLHGGNDYRYAYAGQEHEAECGLYAFDLRFYDPRLGRWSSPDPYGQFWSSYLANANNPASFADPSGGWAYSFMGDGVSQYMARYGQVFHVPDGYRRPGRDAPAGPGGSSDGWGGPGVLDTYELETNRRWEEYALAQEWRKKKDDWAEHASWEFSGLVQDCFGYEYTKKRLIEDWRFPNPGLFKDYLAEKGSGRDPFQIQLAQQIITNFESDPNTRTVFPYIPKQKIVDDLRARVNSGGNEIYQDVNTCGLAAVCNIFADADPLGYAQFTLDLYQFGRASHNDYEISNSEGVADWAATVRPDGMFDGADFVLQASLRYVENWPNGYTIGSWSGLTVPIEVGRLATDLVGLNNITTAALNRDPASTAAQFDPLVLDGSVYIILLTKGPFWGNGIFGPWHYIVDKGAFRKVNPDAIEFDYWDYGAIKRNQRFSWRNFWWNTQLLIYKK